ncbi:MAG: aa3-type cytochrome c oxidase subunit IV [Roseiarcus sp.]
MADDHSVATADSDMDLAEHVSTYGAFVELTGTVIATVVCIILELVLWGLEGHGGVALIGFVLTAAAAAYGGMSGANWRAVAPVVVLLGLACIVL